MEKGTRKQVIKERKRWSKQLQDFQRDLDGCAQGIKDKGLSWDDLKELTNDPTDREAENEAQTEEHYRSLEAIEVGLGHELHKSRDKYSDPYDEFLWLVSIAVGPAVALLVKCSFGPRKVADLDMAQKAKLINYARQKEDELSCAKLEEATRLGLSIDGM